METIDSEKSRNEIDSETEEPRTKAQTAKVEALSNYFIIV